MTTPRLVLFYFTILFSLNSNAQELTQLYTFGGKDLKVSSKYDCTSSYTLKAVDFVIVNISIPKFVYYSASIEELNDEFGKELSKEIGKNVKILRERKIEFKCFGKKFQGFLYELESNGKKSLMISSFGIIENPIYLTIVLKDDSLDFNNITLSTELNKLIAISDIK